MSKKCNLYIPDVECNFKKPVSVNGTFAYDHCVKLSEDSLIYKSCVMARLNKECPRGIYYD